VETLKTFQAFLHESWQEVRYKTTWPAKEDVYAMTGVVLGTTVAFALYLAAVDLAVVKVIQELFNLF
jgi:preprotein translocase SecE subunit